MIGEVISARNKYQAAVKRGSGVKAFKESFKSVMFNCYPDLVMAVSEEAKASQELNEQIERQRKKIEQLEKTIESLNESLAESDRQNNEMRKRLKRGDVNVKN